MKPRATPVLFPSMVADYGHGLLARLAIALLLQLVPLPASARILLLSPSCTPRTLLQHRLPQADIHWHALLPETLHIPLAAHEFDAIIALAPLHTHTNWRTLLSEVPRLLRQGGLLYVATRHNRKFAPTALRSHLTHHGFTLLAGWPATTTTRLTKLLAEKLTLGVFRLSITEAEYD